MSRADSVTLVLASLQVWHSHQVEARRVMNYHLAAVPGLSELPGVSERLMQLRDDAAETVRKIEELQAELQQIGSENG